MKSLNQILQSYVDGYRDLVNEKNRNTSKSIKSALRLNKDEDWSFICASMNIVGDASLAIDNFLRFGLDGPTKYQDEGEKYLRLYGLLNATFLQQNAIKNLYKLNQINDQDEVKNKIDRLLIRDIRHKLGAHSTDYRVSEKDLLSFVPVRVSLNNYCCKYFNNQTHEENDVDLKSYVEKHIKLMIDLLDNIFEKSIKTFFRGNQKKLNEFSQKLADLRLEKNGSLVIESKNGNQKIVIKL